ncbi:MAG TPA: putative DNA modification/repair radical SAM protein [Rhodospirillales bacterium]|nr:putative DNA modification/repair radical SAM protein [Rhodospirillales bacterium]
MELKEKLEILADAAKYDASCASSGAPKRSAAGGNGLGSTQSMGICHSFAPDGRCISLLKILLTNFCTYDCLYCVNRRSSNVRRARFSVDEVVDLTIAFYKRNYIEGLFLSSGVIRNPDYTMEQLAEVARRLRQDHGFRGYIHLKAVPDASPEALAMAGLHADRLSVNVELPTEASLEDLAPEKSAQRIRAQMGGLKIRIDEAKAERKAPRFAPAGQSTQMIVGADAASDGTILQTSARLYASYGLRRVYYSAFSPIPDASARLPLKAAPLVREHRLYQADWLLRFYGFEVDEITGTCAAGMLDLGIDPKLAWALANRERFPVDVNTADRESLLRVPGLGSRTVAKILAARRHAAVRLDDLGRLRVPLRKVMPFVITVDYRPRVGAIDADGLRFALSPQPRQLDLFAS